MIRINSAILTFLWLFSVTGQIQAEWKAGTGKANITPPTPMPMAGYASRGSKHADGKLTELWAKACLLEDESGHRALLITLDLVGIDRKLGADIVEQLGAEFDLKREGIALNTSHTHTGPVVQGNLRPMHEELHAPEDKKLVSEYATLLKQQIVAATKMAASNLAPATIEWGSGTASFAANRRNNPEKEVPQRRIDGTLVGPVDHSVPVLHISQDGKTAALIFGYACHNTTLSSFEWSGDYAGFAQEHIESQIPGCLAMYWAGCGADQNPLPRREVKFARQYGAELGDAVIKVLNGKLRSLPSTLTTNYHEIDLKFDTLPSTDTLTSDAESSNVYVASRAKTLLKQVQAGQPLSPTYPYPVAVWKLGNEVTWVFLGGEVVVDFSLRLKQDLAAEENSDTHIWVAGYSNDVMAYIPSRRVLSEGGYEGGGAMVYYGLPAPWHPDVEEDIASEVGRQLKQHAAETSSAR
ncbi:MAG: neutral/alkaline non-lysosomal ceramidase N-terminal domain-containing protein [Planctomycetaceae bacterium]|nr:neutral/alkaline non-lysosomal ceramidase N-terminal domain-containing protein [Planctomycetaceae bacterium]